MIRTAVGSKRMVLQRGSRITRNWVGAGMPESSLAPWAEQWTKGVCRPYLNPKEKRKSWELPGACPRNGVRPRTGGFACASLGGLADDHTESATRQAARLRVPDKEGRRMRC